MPRTVGNIELYMGPHDIEPRLDDLGAAIIDFINGAQRSLDVAVQELEEASIARALIAKANAGVRVRVVLEASYLSLNTARIDPWIPGGRNEKNRQVHDALLRSKVWVRSDFNPKIFHQKFIIRDRTSILTGSTNFTPTGIHNNLNHVVIIHDARAARFFQKEFNEIRKGNFGARSKAHGEKPGDMTISNVPIRIAFAPDHQPEMEIMKQMLKAKTKVEFAIFTFAQSSGIDDAMINLAQRGVEVRGALDSRQANQTWAATRPVKNAGADLYLVSKKGQLGKLHHKLMVIDEKVVVVGSFNYTGPANRINDENIIILGDLEATDALAKREQRKLAKYAAKEIRRIIEVHGQRIL